MNITIEEAREIDAGALAKLDSLACAVAARVDGTSPSIGYKWPSGAVSYAPKWALGTLAGTLTKSAAGTIHLARDSEGRTFAEWETVGAGEHEFVPRATWGRIILVGSDAAGNTAIVPLERGLELVQEGGKVADKADKLITELGIAAKPKKPDEVTRLRAREAKLAKEEASLAKTVSYGSQYARLDTTALERAEQFYTKRCTMLRVIVEEMMLATSTAPGGHFRELLDTFAPSLPSALMAQAEKITEIPLAHNVKRMTAAVEWHDEARDWVNRTIGEKPDQWRRRNRLTYRSWADGHHGEIRVSPTCVKEAFGRITGREFDNRSGRFSWTQKAPTYSLGILQGRLAVQHTAKFERGELPGWQTKLQKVRNDLGLVRVKLAQKETKSCSQLK